MARVAEHLGISELEERFRTAKDPILARHVQVIWLLAQGHTTAEVSAVTSFVPRWIEQLLARYNAEGLAALGDLRRHNGRAPALLKPDVFKPDVLERLRVRLADPPPDGGLWTSGTVARWMAGELGREVVSAQRGWEALRRIGWSIQKPRPRHPKAATPEEGAAVKKNWTRSLPKRPRAVPTSRSRCSRPTSTASA
jgi:transposase